jgi:hypothetical protein
VTVLKAIVVLPVIQTAQQILAAMARSVLQLQYIPLAGTSD